MSFKCLTLKEKAKLRRKALEALTDENYGDDGDGFHEHATAQAVLALLDEIAGQKELIAELKAAPAAPAAAKGAFMTLAAAIVHADENSAALSGEYAERHAQLASWFRQLQEYRSNDLAGGWVFCTEELPVPGETVIITNGRRVGEGRIGKMNAAGACPSFPVGALYGAFDVPDSWGERYCKPVAWMPLPVAPQKDFR